MWAWVMQYQIRLIKGKTNPKEGEYIINYLNDILKRTNKSELVGQDYNSFILIPKEEKIDIDKNGWYHAVIAHLLIFSFCQN